MVQGLGFRFSLPPFEKMRKSLREVQWSVKGGSKGGGERGWELETWRMGDTPVREQMWQHDSSCRRRAGGGDGR